MDFPFDLTFESPAPAGTFINLNGVGSPTHDAAENVMKFSTGTTHGIWVVDAPVQERFVYGAEMRFTEDFGWTNNNFGLYNRQKNFGSDWSGYFCIHHQTGETAAQKSWYFQTVNAGSGTTNIAKIDQDGIGVPQYVKNEWYDFRMEFDTKTLDP